MTDRMRRSAGLFAAASALALAVGALPVAAQLPSASAAVLGTANNYTARARGFAAIGANPAGLAMPGSPTFSIALPTVQLRQGLGPVSLRDIDRFEGRFVPDAQKEEWLRKIAAAGRQSGAGALELSAVSLSAGPVGFQMSTVGLADASLNEDAAELLLFGNAGRSGTARDFDLENSSMSGSLVTTFGISGAVALGSPLGAPPDHAIAVGATVKYTVGNALLVARDAGSFVDSDPIAVEIVFPVLQTDTAFEELSNGSGFGLDLGAAWEGGPVALGLVVENVFHTFAWDLDAMYFRPGEALFDDEQSDSDFGPRPSSEAPASLRDAVARQTFDPRIALGAAYRASTRIRLMADVRHRFGDGVAVGPKTHAGLGMEYMPVPSVPLRAGLAAVSGGVQVGGGAGLIVGPFHVAGAALYQTGERANMSLYMLTLSFGAQ